MRKIYTFIVFIFISQLVFAQPLTGPKAIPGDYATIAVAVNDLNTKGVGAGGVIFNVAAGHIETSTSEILLTATGVAGNTIVFQKSGAGANPKITRTDAGNLVPTAQFANGDAIIKLGGGDYISFSNIDVSATEPGVEYGYFLTKNSATDASKFVVIQNAAIILAKGSSSQYTTAVYVSNHLSVGALLSSATGATITSTGGASENISINGNTISNSFHGIHTRGSSAAAYYDQNITIGSVGSGNTIFNFGSVTTATTSYGIYTIYLNNGNVSYNTIDNTGGGGSTHNSSLYGIFVSTATNASEVISNNTVVLSTTSTLYGIQNAAGGTGTSNNIIINNNIVTGCSNSGTAINYLLYNSATAFNLSIYNNQVVNNSSTSTGTTYCLYQSGLVVNQSDIYNNVVTGNTKSTTGTFYCLYADGATTSTANVYRNTINNNSAGGGSLIGIYNGAAGTATIYNHNIYNLSSSGTTGIVYGMQMAAGLNNNVYNNFISDLRTPDAAPAGTTDVVRGIHISAVTANSTHNISFNTVYLDGTSSAANFSSSALYHTYSTTATSGSLNMRNNILVNNSTPKGTGLAVAFRRSAATNLNNYGSASNNNDLYAGTPGTTNLIYYDGTTGQQTIATFKALVSARDNASISELPPFINLSSAPYDLHIASNISTQIESGGIAVSGITRDIDNEIRFGETGYAGGGSAPDMGADEIEGRPADFTSPAITYTAFKFTCSAADRTLSATITDAGGMPTAGAFVPRVYYKKQSGVTWYSQPGTLITGNSNNSTWNFVIVAADMGGLNINDVVQYYVAAQDNAANLASNPSGAAGTNVTTITTHPASPNGYKIAATLNGTYTINSAVATGGTNFQTFNDAVNVCVSGPVVFNVQPGTYNEQLLLVPIAGVSAINTITFNGNGQTLSYTSTNTSERAVIKFNDADYITFNNLNIVAGGVATTEYGYGIQMVNDADFNTINNCTITATSAPVTAASTNFAGIVINSLTSTTAVLNGDSKCDNNTFSGNTITGGYYGIVISADGGSNFLVNNNNVTGNTIKDFYSYGIYSNGTNGSLIEGNDISRPTRASVGVFYGIYFTEKSTNAKVSKNKVHNSFDQLLTSISSSFGIYFVSSDATAGNENIVSNNWIYAQNNVGTQNALYNSGSDFIKYYFNSILLDNPTANTTTTNYFTRGFYQTVIASGIELKNNIIRVTRNNPDDNQCLYFNTVGTTFVSDNNILDMATTAVTINSVAYINATEYPTLANWKLTGNDPNSKDGDPQFASATDLHILQSSPASDAGIGIAGITTDIDGEARMSTRPEIGADEFPLSTGIDMQASALVSRATTGGCYGTETVTVRISNNSLNAIDFVVSPVTVTTNVTGAGTATLSAVVNTGSLASGATLDVTMTTPGATIDMSAVGTYIFNASTSLTGDVNNGNNAMPETGRTKLALATGTIAASPVSYCVNGGTPTLSSTGADGFSSLQWQQSITSGNGFTNISGGTTNPYMVTSNIAGTTYYRLVASCGATSLTSSEASVLVVNPQVLSTTPATICGPGTVNLSASTTSGYVLNWYTAANGGIPVFTGTNYTTPVIANSTNYYVSASDGGTNFSAGRPNPFAASTGFTGNDYGLVFDATQAFELKSVDVYSTATGGSITVELLDGAGTVIRTSGVLAIPSGTGTTFGGGATPTTLTLNFAVPAGTGYRLRSALHSGNIVRDNPIGSNFSFPLPIGTSGSITSGLLSGSANANTYYYFYNWQVSTGCESSRTAVTATVKNTPDNATTLAGTNNGVQVCNSYDVASANYYFANCNLIARVTPQGGFPVAGNINSCVRIDATVQSFGGQTYVQRHYDVEPATNASTATARLILYATQAEFTAYNAYVVANTLSYPLLPISPSDVNTANVRVTQFHGTGTAPGNYTGGPQFHTPVSVVWNSTNNWWEITVDVTGFSGFYIHTGSANFPLPAQLLTFSGARQGNANLLRWTVAQETDVQWYQVERSEEGTLWNKIGAVAGLGNTSSQRTYQFTDNNISGDRQMYRLLLLDINGKEKLSNIISIKGIKPAFLTLTGLFPNPVSSTLHIQVDAPVKDNLVIMVIDAAGRVVKVQKNRIDAGSNNLLLNVTELAAGSYAVKITGEPGSKCVVSKFVKE